MRLAFLFLVPLSFPTWGQEVARLFGKPVSAAELRLTDEKSLAQAAGTLRQRVLKEAMQRFIAQHRLQASDADLAAYEKFDAEFQRLERASMQGAGEGRRRVIGPWIESYKARKALYEKYGGAVAITKWGPDPVGATAALLREHEKLGEIRIADPALAAEFWRPLEAPPRLAANRPEHFDFTYYWLKPVGEIR